MEEQISRAQKGKVRLILAMLLSALPMWFFGLYLVYFGFFEVSFEPTPTELQILAIVVALSLLISIVAIGLIRKRDKRSKKVWPIMCNIWGISLILTEISFDVVIGALLLLPLLISLAYFRLGRYLRRNELVEAYLRKDIDDLHKKIEVIGDK